MLFMLFIDGIYIIHKIISGLEANLIDHIVIVIL